MVTVRASAFPLILLALAQMEITPARAEIKSLNELSYAQTVALQESERRLTGYDHALMALDHDQKKGKISPQTFSREERDLSGFIIEESAFQNDLLMKDSKVSQDFKKVMQNVARFSTLLPQYVVLFVSEAFLSSGAR